jgi:plastocyanin
MISPFHSVSAALAIASLSTATIAGTIEVRVVDGDGRPLPEFAVYANPESADRETGRIGAGPGSARVDQRDMAFKPHILIVETGTLIEFPNSDQILHHVYSFSPAKRFELPLYGGSTHSPLLFNEPGLVTLGCNIHDDMLGYVLVVDTPYFAMTDADGIASLSGLPDGHYAIETWTPRLRPSAQPAAQAVSVAGGTPAEVSFEISGKLFPPHAQSETSLKWSDY